MLWLELTKAITATLPRDLDREGGTVPSLDEKPLDQREEIYIDAVESEYFTDLSSEWFSENQISEKYALMQQDRQRPAGAPVADDAEGSDAEGEGDTEAAAGDEEAPAEDEAVTAEGDPAVEEPPAVEGSGWVIEIKGHHFRHNGTRAEGSEYVRTHLIDQLDFGTVELPLGPDGQMQEFRVRELGILWPVEIDGYINQEFEIPNPKYDPTADMAAMRPGGRGQPRGMLDGGTRRRRRQRDTDDTASNEPKEKPTINEPAYEFVVQFCWKQVSNKERLKNRRAAAEAAEDAEGGF